MLESYGMKRVKGAVLIACLLAGCTTTQRGPTSGEMATQSVGPKSAALQVAEAAGIGGLQDIPSEVFHRSKVEAAQQNRPQAAILNGISGPGMAIGGYITPPPGFTPGAALGLGLLSWLSSPPVPPPARFTTRVLVWIPAEMAGSADQAQAWADQEFRTAVLRAMHLTDLVEKEGVFRPLLASETRFRVLAKPDCPPVTEGRRDAYDAACSGTLVTKLLNADIDLLRTSSSPPAVLGLPQSARGPLLVLPQTSGLFREWLKKRDNLRQLAKELPPSFAIYLPPIQNDLPVVLHGQDSWLFVAPENNTATL